MKRSLLASLLTLTAVLAADQRAAADCRYSGTFSWHHSYEHTSKCRTFSYHSEPHALPPMCTSACSSSGPACAAAPPAYPAPAYGAPAYPPGYVPGAPAVVGATPTTGQPAPSGSSGSSAPSGSSGYIAPQPTPATSWAPYATGTQTVGYSYARQAAGAGSYPYGAGSTGYAGYGSGAPFQAPSYWYGD